MSDSVCLGGSVVVGGEVAAGVSGVPVVPGAGGEREQALGDAGDQTGHGVCAVVFEGELALDGVDDRFDPLAYSAEVADAGWFAFAVGAQEERAEFAHQRLELSPAKPLSAITV